MKERSFGMSQIEDIDVPFCPDPARVLVLCCCDGRFIDAVEQYLADVDMEMHDLVAFPGGPANLDPFSAPFLSQQAVSESLNFMIAAHATTHLFLIAHEDCAYYQKRHGRCDPERQKADLQTAARQVRSRHAGLEIRLCYLRPRPGREEGVTLETIPEQPESTPGPFF
jgi:hypothetical protein